MNKSLLYSLSLFFLTQAMGITKKEGISFVQKDPKVGLEKLQDNEYFKIHDCDVNHILHAMNHDTTSKEFERKKASYHNEHTLLSTMGLNASTMKGLSICFWMSKLAVHAIAQTTYALVAGATTFIYPPAAPVVYCSLQLTFAAFVEIASNIIGYGILALSSTTLI